MPLPRRTFLAGIAAPMILRPAKPRPNIVLILAEDLGAWLLGSYGNKEVRTPHLDLLARSGSRIVSHSVATLGAAASPATLLTGRLPRQHGIEDTLGPAGPPARFRSELMISAILAGSGYECGFAGKWWFGEDAKPQHGFSSWAALPPQERGHVAEKVTGSAVEFLEARKPERPFFLLVSHPSPRIPYDGLPQKYYDLYAGTAFATLGWSPMAAGASQNRELMANPVESLRKCAAAISALDDQIPPVVSVLDKKKLRGNTVVIFTASGGLLAGRHGLWSGGRGSDPVNLYREAVETPMIWNWPGVVPVEGARTELAGSYDLLPTLCSLAEVAVPKDRELCGRSYLPPITNRPFPRREPAWRNQVFASYGGAEMARDSRYKLVLRAGGAGPNELYDLRTDPREFTNQFENDRFVTIRTALTEALVKWRQEYV